MSTPENNAWESPWEKSEPAADKSACECNCIAMALSGNGPMMQDCPNPNCQYYAGAPPSSSSLGQMPPDGVWVTQMGQPPKLPESPVRFQHNGFEHEVDRNAQALIDSHPGSMLVAAYRAVAIELHSLARGPQMGVAEQWVSIEAYNQLLEANAKLEIRIKEWRDAAYAMRGEIPATPAAPAQPAKEEK